MSGDDSANTPQQLVNLLALIGEEIELDVTYFAPVFGK
jgi:hypothetical protein